MRNLLILLLLLSAPLAWADTQAERIAQTLTVRQAGRLHRRGKVDINVGDEYKPELDIHWEEPR